MLLTKNQEYFLLMRLQKDTNAFKECTQLSTLVNFHEQLLEIDTILELIRSKHGDIIVALKQLLQLTNVDKLFVCMKILHEDTCNELFQARPNVAHKVLHVVLLELCQHLHETKEDIERYTGRLVTLNKEVERLSNDNGLDYLTTNFLFATAIMHINVMHLPSQLHEYLFETPYRHIEYLFQKVHRQVNVEDGSMIKSYIHAYTLALVAHKSNESWELLWGILNKALDVDPYNYNLFGVVAEGIAKMNINDFCLRMAEKIISARSPSDASKLHSALDRAAPGWPQILLSTFPKDSMSETTESTPE